MGDLYQQSKTVSLPKRLSLARKARAGENGQRLLPTALAHVRGGGLLSGKGPLQLLECLHFPSRCHMALLAALNYFHFQTTGKTNQSQHNLRKLIAGCHVCPGRCLQRSRCNGADWGCLSLPELLYSWRVLTSLRRISATLTERDEDPPQTKEEETWHY